MKPILELFWTKKWKCSPQVLTEAFHWHSSQENPSAKNFLRSCWNHCTPAAFMSSFNQHPWCWSTSMRGQHVLHKVKGRETWNSPALSHIHTAQYIIQNSTGHSVTHLVLQHNHTSCTHDRTMPFDSKTTVMEESTAALYQQQQGPWTKEVLCRQDTLASASMECPPELTTLQLEQSPNVFHLTKPHT
jgi:hypothetical protein